MRNPILELDTHPVCDRINSRNDGYGISLRYTIMWQPTYQGDTKSDLPSLLCFPGFHVDDPVT